MFLNAIQLIIRRILTYNEQKDNKIKIMIFNNSEIRMTLKTSSK